MPSPRAAHALFCDDVIRLDGNKVTFSGIYSGDMILPAPKPGRLGRFCTVTFLICDPDDLPQHVAVRAYAPGQATEFARGELSVGAVALREGAVKAVIRVVTESTSVEIADEGDIEVYVESDGNRLRAGRLAVRFA